MVHEGQEQLLQGFPTWPHAQNSTELGKEPQRGQTLEDQARVIEVMRNIFVSFIKKINPFIFIGSVPVG